MRISNIIAYNEYNKLFLNELAGLINIEWRFGYFPSKEEQFPSWRYLTRDGFGSVNVRDLPLTIHAMFTGNKIYNTSGKFAGGNTVEVTYTYRWNFLLPVRHEDDTETDFWNRIDYISDLFNYREYKIPESFQNRFGINSVFREPMSFSVDKDPYTEFLGVLCHYTEGFYNIYDTVPYGIVAQGYYDQITGI